MTNGDQKKLGEFVAAQMERKTWTVEDAINVLVTVDTYNAGKSEHASIVAVNESQDRCIRFLHDGINNGHLHLLGQKSDVNDRRNMVAKVAGGLGVLALAGVGAPMSALMAATKLLPLNTEKKPAFAGELLAIEVAEYAKAHNRWVNLDAAKPVERESEGCNLALPKPVSCCTTDSAPVEQSCHDPEVCQDDKPTTKPGMKGKPGADARWAAREPLIRCATEFMLDQLNRGCRCHHGNLSKLTYETAYYEGKPLKGFDGKGVGLKAVIKLEAKKIVQPNRVFGSEAYEPQITCPLSDHWGISRRSK